MTSSLIDIIFSSEKRKNLLLLLMGGPKDRDEIKSSLNVTSTAIIPQIKKLKEWDLVIQDDGTYRLSDMGEVVVENMKPLLNTVQVLEENQDFWRSRNLGAIPKDLFNKFGDLGNCIIIEPDLNYLFEFPREFTENIIRSKYVMAFTTYFHPEYPSLYSKLAGNGIDVSLVLTKSVFERMKNDYRGDIEKLAGLDNTELAICDEVQGLATVVTTDRFMYVSFFDKNGKYDHRILMSFDSSALEWGQSLFEYYKDLSENVTEI